MSDLDLIKQRLDVVELVGQYVELKKAGSNFRGICPFHNEKTPSFMVNPTLQIYKCFGCGKGGDVISFIEEIEKLDFKDALNFAAEKAGVELTNANIKKDKKLEEAKKKAIQAHSLSAKFYNYILKSHNLGKKGRDYASKRNISSKEIDRFMFGYAPNTKKSLKDYLIKKGFKENELISFGLLIERNGEIIDKFRNRLMQPIFDLKGNIVGFSGRYIGMDDRAPKYLNSPETIIYKKNEILYGLYNSLNTIRKDGFVVLVEGNLDVVAPFKIGFENVVAPLGTSFTTMQAQLLKRYVDLIYFCFDTDKAGLNSLIRSLAIVEEIGIRHKTLDLEEYKDPDELINSNPQKWKEVIKNAKSTVSYLFTRLSEGLDLGNPDDKITFRNKIVPILKSIKDEVELSHYIKEASVLLEISQDEFNSTIRNSSSVPYKKTDSLSSKASSESREEKVFNLENYLLALIVQYSNELTHEIDTVIFENINIKNLLEVLIENKFQISNEKLLSLENDLINLYKQSTIYDISSIENFQSEIKNTYTRLRINFFKKEILKLRKALLLNEEDIESLQKLSELSKELKKVQEK